jgi:uncharacterized membrane protein
MTILLFVLALATFLCSLVAGLLLSFAIVVMPGIGKLDDGGFIRAFQVIDRVIQNNQPLFLFVWVGSVLAVIATAVLGTLKLSGTDRLLVIAATVVYLLGVQLPTATINVPMNNELQKLDLSTMNETMLKRARSNFEPRWNRWNVIRAACSICASILLLLLLLKV